MGWDSAELEQSEVYRGGFCPAVHIKRLFMRVIVLVIVLYHLQN